MKKKYLAIFMGMAIAASMITAGAADVATENVTETVTEAAADGEETEAELDMVYGVVSEVKDNTLTLAPDTEVEDQKDDLEEQSFTIEEGTPILTFKAEDFKVEKPEGPDGEAPKAEAGSENAPADTDSEAVTDAVSEATTDGDAKAAPEADAKADDAKDDAQKDNRLKEDIFVQISEMLKTDDMAEIQDTLTTDCKAEEATLEDLKADQYAGVIMNADGTVAGVLAISDGSEL